ncbi:hypothetical protein SAMD00023520_00066 [Listeria monocytogenes]|nr:hypothetical protein SAMD00023520_00066 [Listeria monocytogenes]
MKRHLLKSCYFLPVLFQKFLCQRNGSEYHLPHQKG